MLEEHSSCLEAGKRSKEPSLPLLVGEGTHMWEARSDQPPLGGEPLLEGYSLPFLSRRLRWEDACHRAAWPDCGLWEEGDKIVMGEHTVDPAIPSWAADILLQEGGKRLAAVLLPPRRDGRRGEEADVLSMIDIEITATQLQNASYKPG